MQTGSGIGKDIGNAFAAEGAKGLAFADIDLNAANIAANASKAFSTSPEYCAIALLVDVTSETSVQECMRSFIDTFGIMEFCVNSAGVCSHPPTYPNPGPAGCPT